MTSFKRIIAIFAWTVFSSALLATAAFAQVTGSIRGTIVDPSGAVVADATVTAISEATGMRFTTVSNSEGIYSFPVLNVGTYKVTAEKAGFKQTVRPGQVLELNQTLRIDLVMEVGAVTEQIEVSEAAPLVESESSSLGRVIARREVVDLPLNKRNFTQLVVLLPGSNFGAAGTIGGGDRPDDPRPRSSYFANGLGDASNTYLIDGVDNYDRVHATTAVKPSIDAIEQFKVQTSLYSAEFGRNAGGVVNVAVKSGNNQFRGSLYEFLRNEKLDARHFFAPRTQPKPHYVLNQFGGTLGGPVVRDRLFFFGSYERFMERRGETLTSTVPTEAMRRGDFRGLGVTIYDPLTTVQTGSTYTRSAFPDNVIPANRIDVPASRLVALYPAPMNSALSNNFTYSPSRKQDTDQIDGRVDYVLTSRATIFGRYSFGDTDTITPGFIPGKGMGGARFAGPNKMRTQGAALGYTHTLSPTVVNELRLGYTRIRSNVYPFFFGEKLSEEMGIPGANQDDFSSGLTRIVITGFTGLGNSNFMPIYKIVNNYQITDNLNYSRGKHILKFGVHFLRPQTAHFQSAVPPGQFSFNATFTNNPASPAGTGNAMASFLLGFPAGTTRTAQLSPTYLRYLEHALYVQDDWKIHPKLTLNLGLRYELITPAFSNNDHLSNFDFRTGKVILAGKDTSRTAGVRTDKNNFAPRFGFAYSVNPKTVVRGGYGVFYDAVPMFGLLRPFPFLIQYTVTTGNFFVMNRMSEGFPAADFDIAKNAARPFGTLDAVPFDNPLAYVQQFNLNVQRSLPGSIAAKVAYVGTMARKLRWTYDENIPRPGPGAVQQRRPYYGLLPDVVGLRVNHPEGNSNYHSLQASLEKRFAGGLAFQASYTWSKWIDDAVWESGYGSQGPSPQDLYNRRADRGLDPADIRHRLVYSWIYELPYGRGKRWGAKSGPAAWVLGGWQINGITTLQSGLPFTVAVGSSTTNTGTGSRADRIADGRLEDSERALGRFFDTGAFRTPAQYTYGNAGRNILFGPGTVNFDFSLFKNFRVNERANVQFRSEFFNTFNTPQFGLPGGTLGTSSFGVIGTLANDMRQMQFSLKLAF